MQHETYGYIRVSTKDQNEARQLDALAKMKIPLSNIYIDKQSGKDFERPAWQELVHRLGEGNLLVVKSIDRLGRNYDDILEQWRIITKEIHADVLVLDMPLLDTRMKENNLTGTFIADLVLQILSYVAQTERENIRQRQAEGIAAARSRGIRFGRPVKEIPGFEVIYLLWKEGSITATEAAVRCGLSRQGFYKRVGRYADGRDGDEGIGRPPCNPYGPRLQENTGR
ncbi:recombinase family protein [Luxibacter massiliensis]|uniref:recombinase family protein n=1 Tax=Luxibacter massiliensis TaxID=2219695 RepID=UPI000F06C8F8|nr:recombinase family protein [Luxibacter massiliensis]